MAAVDLPVLIGGTRDEHPRGVIRALTSAVLAAYRGSLADDATTLVLDWHDSHTGQRSTNGGSNH
ncbi:hypothetical protein [Streptomyces sp. PanSC9]|uniref:hypothetical protein n=1 Tax=Streptomyces sp. PanSC9 TaxID=1520461 RepID=UPI0011CEB6E6|nr:hypothetical protein [Streptomyces sp. PanSC9]